jgi:hypothetical protein
VGFFAGRATKIGDKLNQNAENNHEDAQHKNGN